ncbi:hypothetical protein [Flavilitoribacter nigricans]|uniref:DUF3108 domain-containing protein n=1 Tax=Flavilitoribacter nigricans (strain ATCC 23147 / DSM 23189 / NBRC 102662 / NCIMB 1420 / SS-2) TaxID=1122177 RepID=A0A2D0N236_FLAN2|nr:hypothetical protein [Flavilitoribacter nigricans]PHN02517.1 hypothetical protein CRP01_31570 [Flavilitoribacter nigricans DSM 23189 = NBRC 102662]
MFRLVISLCLLTGCTIAALSQNEGFRFSGKVARGDYYLLRGKMDGKYDIHMYLTVQQGARCGEGWKAIQHKNGGIDGWYKYERIGQKLPITGTYLNEHSVRLFVPQTPGDTIDAITCEMENYRETFWNESDFDLTRLRWQKKGARKVRQVELEVLHDPGRDTVLLIFERPDKKPEFFNMGQLLGLPEIDKIEVIAYTRSGTSYHLLFRLEYNGWREYREYLGHLVLNEQAGIEDLRYFLSYDSWQPEKEKLIYDARHPERGIRKPE